MSVVKNFIGVLLLLLSVSTSWSQNVSNNPSQRIVKADDSATMIFLGTIADVKSSGYSVAADADAKVVQFLHGEGVNPYNSYLVINSGGSPKVWPLLHSISDVSRITFSGLRELTVNYTQSTFDGKDNETVEKKSIKVKFSTTEDGILNDHIEIDR